MTSSTCNIYTQNHGMDKRTKWNVNQMYSWHKKEREYEEKNQIKSQNLKEISVMYFLEGLTESRTKLCKD